MTNNVLDFKVSAHPSDSAMILFVKRDPERLPALYVLNNIDSNKLNRGNCPKSENHVIFTNLATVTNSVGMPIFRFDVVDNVETTIVQVALSASGNFRAWDNKQAVYSQGDVVDYDMHGFYHVKDKPFSSYVAFIIDKFGLVTKIKGVNPGCSKVDELATYKDLRHFKSSNHIDEAKDHQSYYIGFNGNDRRERTRYWGVGDVFQGFLGLW